MNKAELIDAVRDRLGIDKKTADSAVEAVIDTITRTVAAGEKVAITGFGVFERVERGARTARNPATGATVKVKKTSVPKFRAGSNFKDVVSGAKKVARVADAATKAAAKSVGKTAAKTARTAATAPGKAASAASKAASKSRGAVRRRRRRPGEEGTGGEEERRRRGPPPRRSPGKSTARPLRPRFAVGSTAKKTAARKTSARKS